MAVRVELDGKSDPIIGQLIGLDTRLAPQLNRVTLRTGRALEDAGGAASRPGASAIPALVSEAFAAAHALKPGARLSALMNGKRRTLVIAGIALSPEYVFAGLWGMPDQRGFGVFWIDAETMAAMFDMQGAFNRLAIRLAPQAAEREIIDALTRVLAPYGGREAIGRADQTSNAMLANEIKEQHVLGTVLPTIFLAVAAFLLNVVVSRLVSTQREQIAALKALGYPNPTIAAHYLKLVLVIVGIGLLIGVWIGDVLGGLFTGLYAELFRFPTFNHRIAPWLLGVSDGFHVERHAV
jgi:putative ABC transport system permease protein